MCVNRLQTVSVEVLCLEALLSLQVFLSVTVQAQCRIYHHCVLITIAAFALIPFQLSLANSYIK